MTEQHASPTETTTTAETASTTARESIPAAAAGIAEEVLKLGTGWARYGLEVGQSALKNSALTLETTAKLLARLGCEIFLERANRLCGFLRG
jgi:hypothetical protein